MTTMLGVTLIRTMPQSAPELDVNPPLHEHHFHSFPVLWIGHVAEVHATIIGAGIDVIDIYTAIVSII
jgi:hypothetical protein